MSVSFTVPDYSSRVKVFIKQGSQPSLDSFDHEIDLPHIITPIINLRNDTSSDTFFIGVHGGGSFQQNKYTLNVEVVSAYTVASWVLAVVMVVLSIFLCIAVVGIIVIVILVVKGVVCCGIALGAISGTRTEEHLLIKPNLPQPYQQTVQFQRETFVNV